MYSVNQPITFKVVIMCACARACFCVFAGNLLNVYASFVSIFTANFPLFFITWLFFFFSEIVIFMIN